MGKHTFAKKIRYFIRDKDHVFPVTIYASQYVVMILVYLNTLNVTPNISAVIISDF